MNNIAIITARSGSKGLKDKNIKLLNGMPMLAYSIEAAKESGKFCDIIVSTDSEKYAKISRNWGADVPFLRSKDTSSDNASSWDAVKEVIEKLKKIGKEYDTITLLQPTSPLREASDIISGYKIFEEKKAEAVIGVCEMEHSPLWSNTLDDNCSMRNFINKEILEKGRQSLPTYYRINGALYIIKTEVLDDIEKIYGEKSFAYIMKKENSVDIDTKYDFSLAEMLLRERMGEKNE